MKKIMLIIFIVSLLQSTVVLATDIDADTNTDGYVLVKSNIDSKIREDLETQITNINTGDVFVTSLLAKYDYDGKIKLPYGNYKITFIKVPEMSNDEFEMDYGQLFTISEDEEPRVDISIKDTNKAPEVGALKLRVNAPTNFIADVKIIIDGNEYILNKGSRYEKTIDLQVGEHRIENVNVDQNKYEVSYNSFIYIENKKDTDSKITITEITKKEPVKSEEPTTPIDIKEPEDPKEAPILIEDATNPSDTEPPIKEVKSKSPLMGILLSVAAAVIALGLAYFAITKLYSYFK